MIFLLFREEIADLFHVVLRSGLLRGLLTGPGFAT